MLEDIKSALKDVERYFGIDGNIKNLKGLQTLISLAESVVKAEEPHSKQDDIKEFIEKVYKKPDEMIKLCEEKGFVFDNSNDRWQKLAFTFYSEIVQLSSEAQSIRQQLLGKEEGDE